ncbi:4-vinyl reductase [Candidatus Bathyarchaeota archaeon]|nr:4-vinyl reductase [Candidatus Bathyarchaeota archaeon]
MQTSPKGKPNAWDLRRLVGSVNQVRFNDNKGEVSFFGQKMIILRRDVIRVMRDGLERLVAEQAAPFLSYLASGIGIHEGSIFRDSITSTGAQQRMELESLVHSAFEDTNLGLGRIKIRSIDFDKASASISIANCFEAMENGQSEEPNCMFTGGFLAGLFAEVLDKTVQAKETKCISQGAPECEFEISLADSEETVETKKETAAVEAQKPGTTASVEKPASTAESKAAQKPTTVAKENGQTQPQGPSQSDMDAGVETASRIAKRKEGFWAKHFKKND